VNRNVKFIELIAFYNHLWQNNRASDFSGDLRSLLNKTNDPDGIEVLVHALHCELLRHEKFSEAVLLIEEQITKRPADVLLRIRLAEDLFYFVDRPGDALRKIESAIELAKTFNSFKLLALGVKARILRSMEDFRGLELCLLQILDAGRSKVEGDIGPEDDFIRDLPSGAISEGVLRSYRLFCAGLK
jgi:hypothetical protein